MVSAWWILIALLIGAGAVTGLFWWIFRPGNTRFDIWK